MAATTVPEPAGEKRRASIVGVASLDAIASSILIAAVYVLQGVVWYYSAKGKIFDDDLAAPSAIARQYDGTFIDSTIGVDAAWAVLGIMQAIVFVAIVASLLRGEFLPSRRKPVLLAALAGAMLVFAAMVFGQEMTHQFDSVASLYAYFGATAVLFILIRLMPPYRAARWMDEPGS